MKFPPKTFPDNIKMTLNDETFSKSIAPVLSDMMTPLVQESIASSVTSAIKSLKTTILQLILETSKKL